VSDYGTWRKGQDYGTILVDLDLHRVADLLPDRSSESFSSWLQQHPGIAIIARDRCGLYAEGAALGAPDAQQVADRFHLILNFSSAVERVFEERSRELVLPPEEEPEIPAAGGPRSEAMSPDRRDSLPVRRQQERRQQRLERYERVAELFGKGYTQRLISRELGLGR
jgi:transposase